MAYEWENKTLENWDAEFKYYRDNYTTLSDKQKKLVNRINDIMKEWRSRVPKVTPAEIFEYNRQLHSHFAVVGRM